MIRLTVWIQVVWRPLANTNMTMFVRIEGGPNRVVKRNIKTGAHADLAAWLAFLNSYYYGALEDMGVSSFVLR
jgi:hypothetical protein